MFGLDSFITFLGGQASALNIASTLFNIYSGNRQAKQQSSMYDYQAAMDVQNASTSEGMAQVTADKTRMMGKRAAGDMAAAYGGSGIDPTSGTAAVVQGELSRRVELDALSTMLQGKYQAYGQRVAASQAIAASANAKNSSTWNMGTSLLGGMTRQASLSKWGSKRKDIMTGAVDNWDLAGQH